MTTLPDALDIDGIIYDVEVSIVGGVVFFKVADDEKRRGIFNLAVKVEIIVQLAGMVQE